MDQNDVRLLGGQRLEPGMHRGLARRAAIGRRLVTQARDRLVEDHGVVGIYHRLHGENVRMLAERRMARKITVCPPMVAVLLGSARAGAKAASGCDEDGGGTLGSGHRTQIAGGSG